jgi:hypothetical protein
MRGNDSNAFGRHLLRGITLIEMLVSLVLTLLIMAAVVHVFDFMGNSLRKGRATIQMASELRNAMNQLQRDLDGMTALTLPWVDPDSAAGYFEAIEGPMSDSTSHTNPSANHADLGDALGDIDDVLQFTSRSAEEPFRVPIIGRLVPKSDGRLEWERFPDQKSLLTPIESPLAEVRWWVDHIDSKVGNGKRDPGEPYVLLRRVVLVRPDIDMYNRLTAGSSEGPIADDDAISAAHVPPDGRKVAASLGDLSKREYRYAHKFGFDAFGGVTLDKLMRDYPFLPLRSPAGVNPGKLPSEDPFSVNAEDFFVLGDVLSFDVRVYDPQAPVNVSGRVALVPGDPGYTLPKTPTARGAFVDLNYARDGSSVRNGVSIFSGPPHPKSRLLSFSDGGPASIYDTWPSHYERDGYDQDGDGLIDEGTNGIDDDNINGVDDPGERETSPPYAVPLRGIEVRIRIMDYNTRQVRQVSVVADYTPE